jgi:hypothetical protein
MFIGSLLLSVVVHEFYFVSSISFPPEADAVLIINSDTVLALPISNERFQSIAWRNSQIVETLCHVELRQFANRYSRQGRNLSVPAGFEQSLSFFVSKGPNHNLRI